MHFSKQKELGRIPRQHKQAIEDHVANSQPFILENLAEEWPARKRWTLDYLSEQLGAVKLRTTESSSGAIPDWTPGSVVRTGKIKFSVYLQGLASGNSKRYRLINGDDALIYHQSPELCNGFQRLKPDLPTPDFIEEDKLLQIGMWLSGKGVFSWLHYDNNLMDNLNVQMRGSKSFVLFSPSDVAHLHFHRYTSDRANKAQFSKVDLRNPDPERFPGIERAEALVGTLEEGDAVFIPSCWLHSFTHLGEVNMNVNYWWKPKVFPWNSITARKSLWRAIGLALTPEGNGGGGNVVSQAIESLPAEAKALIAAVEDRIMEEPTIRAI